MTEKTSTSVTMHFPAMKKYPKPRKWQIFWAISDTWPKCLSEKKKQGSYWSVTKNDLHVVNSYISQPISAWCCVYIYLRGWIFCTV